MRRAAKKDVVHNPISEGLEAHGILCMDTHELGNGRPDLLTFDPGVGYRVVASSLRQLVHRFLSEGERNTVLVAASLLEQLAASGRWLPLECKSDNRISHQHRDKRLQPQQVALRLRFPIPIVSTVDEALALHAPIVRV